MKITATLHDVSFDLDGYRQALKLALAEAISHAAFEWIQAVTLAVPTWSGASRATMQHLASKLGFAVEIAVSNTCPYGDRTSLGLSNATGDILTDRADEGIVSFYYSTTLPHLIWNEFNNANLPGQRDPTKWAPPRELLNPGPYHFQEKGEKAVQRAFDNVKLPSPGDFVRSGKTIKV